jgi:hypothetical protein
MSPGRPTPGAGGDHDERWFLTDERDFLRRSLDDAQREHSAGDLSNADYTVLVNRDRRRLEEVEAELEALGPEALGPEAYQVPYAMAPSTEASPRRSSRAEWRRVGIIACCFLIVAGAAILVTHALQGASPGQPLTGSISVPKQQLIEQQLQEATTFNDENQDLAALQLLEQVLTEDPNNPEALADAGWLQWKNGYTAKKVKVEQAGQKDVAKAVKLSPTFYKGHLYLGLILFFDQKLKAAQPQFADFLIDGPPVTDVASASAVITAVYQKAGLPVPAVVTSSTSTTTTTTANKTTSTTSAP